MASNVPSPNPFWEYLTPIPSITVPQKPRGRNFSYHVGDRVSRRDQVLLSSGDDSQNEAFLAQRPDLTSSPPPSIFAHKTSNSTSRSSSKAPRSIPPQYEFSSWPLTDKSLSPHQDEPCHTRQLLRAIILPTIIVVVPMTLLIAALLGLIFGYRVKSDDSLFSQISNTDLLENRGVFLVNYSATRIVFVASWASTLAPLLAGFVMNLDSFYAALLMIRSSAGIGQHDLPTPYQYSLLVGLCLASIGRLRRYFSYSGEKDVVIPPVLRRTARTLSLTLFLACVVFAADSAVHYTTSTIAFDEISISSTRQAYGRGLSEACLTLNRSENYGLPCSRNGVVAVEDYNAYVTGQNEIFILNHAESNISEIRLVDPPASQNAAKVALLIPQHAGLNPLRDFRAETAGIVTTCTPITNTKCRWIDGNPLENYSQFNCSDNFWGILGKKMVIDDTGTALADPDVPVLGFKPSSGMQYAYFKDADLSIPYDSVGDLQPVLSDSELINPVYFGFAARFASVSQKAGVNMTLDPGVHKGLTATLDVVLQCQYTTYAVDYNWVDSKAYINTMTPSPNGTIAEIFHGYALTGSFSAFDNDLQDLFLKAVLSQNSQELAETFANDYSSRVMGVIGPFLSQRENIQEQTRTVLLVAKVPKIPLAFLVACCLAYVLFGIAAAARAYKALNTLDVRDLAFRFSLPALALHAFRDKATDASAMLAGPDCHAVFDETRIRGETMRVAVEGDTQNGFNLKSLV